MKLSVGVFFGGRSVEHEVSVITAVQAMHAMDKARYEVLPFYTTKEGVLYTGDALFEIERYRDIAALLALCTPVVLQRRRDGVYAMRAEPKRFGSNELGRVDVAFPAVHGTNTEDGSLQGFFETLLLPYAGCDVLSSALGMDKMAQKQVLKDAGLPVLDAICFHTRDYVRDAEAMLNNIEARFGYPVIVKPVNLGSSVGIGVANDREALRAAIDQASGFAFRLLCERAVGQLREINCAVLGDYEEVVPSFLEEPVTSGEILSYTDKYLSGGGAKQGQKGAGMSGARRRLPADLPPEKAQEIRELALAAFHALGCNGVVRIDFLIDTADGDRVYINEPNTIPGSLAFYLFQPAGIPYDRLIDRLIELALKRQRERATLIFSYETNIFDTKQTGALKGIKGMKG
ncbi:MAG: D-alanine--D-alanine ligase [Clostridiales bacterium]|nr:D-alanine--D-alanine ligase [Clostridiales bacterium]